MTTHPTPTKPGYYWARLNSLNAWEVIQLRLGLRCGPDHPRDLLAYRSGTRTFYYAEEFTSGPEVQRPEGLE